MSSRRWRGERRRRRRKWWRAHTIENLSRRGTATRQIQRSKWRFYANRGFHFSSHRPSAILCFHSFSPLPLLLLQLFVNGPLLSRVRGKQAATFSTATVSYLSRKNLGREKGRGEPFIRHISHTVWMERSY